MIQYWYEMNDYFLIDISDGYYLLIFQIQI
jgi:hypothetical protein